MISRWKKNRWMKIVTMIAMIAMMTTLLSSCNPLSKGATSKKKSTSPSVVNSPDSVGFGYGRVLRSNPTVLSGNWNLDSSVDMNTFLNIGQDFITNNSTLTKECTFGIYSINDCMKVYNSLTDSAPLVATDGKWAYDANSSSFLQVNAFYHVSNFIDRFLGTLEYASTMVSYGLYDSALSGSIGANRGFWYGDSSSLSTLTVYSKCMPLDNAYFDPANFTLCFGESEDNPGLVYSQDPSIIYHEMGHAFVHIMFNSRNMVYDYGNAIDPIQDRANFGSYAYDEAGSINEGLADYLSYVMTARTHFGEWGLKEFSGSAYLASDRAMSEDDSSHAPGLATDSSSRLSYPRYLHYDMAAPDDPIEDIHFAGQVTSHFLVALTEDLKDTCSFSAITSYNSKYANAANYDTEHIGATQHILYALSETLSQMGDLTAVGGDNYAGENFVNLTREASYLWSHVVNPPNYRSFFQVFARNMLQINSIICPSYSQNQLEQLMDDYGLLLFKSYNNDGNDASNGHSGAITQVNHSNRIDTVLINKDLIGLPTGESITHAYIIDAQSSMRSAIQALSFNGTVTSLSDSLYDDLRYNNGNAQVSPGEVVGIALNLINNSNTTMAGVQVLGNDWDHMKEDGTVTAPDLRPCAINGWPNESEGVASADSNPAVEGDCDYITRENGTNSVSETSEQVSPICLVEQRNDDDTSWVSQNTFRKTIPISDAECLHSDDVDSCLIRVLPGAESAIYSKIDPQKNFMQTLQGDSAISPSMKYSNLIMMEVSKEIPPGTKFNCRFRVRFSNCSDCYTDPNSASDDDFLDYEYSGHEPFKVINLQFSVVN